jgi:hypothetical protein
MSICPCAGQMFMPEIQLVKVDLLARVIPLVMRPGFGHLFMSAIQPSTQLVRGVTIERRKSQKSVEWRSKVVVAQRASGFNLEIELKNIILRRVSIFEFLHSQGQ